MTSELHATQHKFGSKDRSCNRDELDLAESHDCSEATPIKKPNSCLSRGAKRRLQNTSAL